MENANEITETAPVKKTRAKKTVTAETTPVKSSVLGVVQTASPGAVENAYRTFVAQTKAKATSATHEAQKASATEVGKLSRANEEPRKALKRKTARDKQIAHDNYTAAKRAAQSGYDSELHRIELHNDAETLAMSTEFNAACEPITTSLLTDLAKIESAAAEQIAAATAEYTVEFAAAQMRARDAAEAKAVADAAKATEVAETE